VCVPGGRQIRFNLAAKLSPKTSPDIRFEFGQEARSGTYCPTARTIYLPGISLLS
jgi:hypothetical protein